ncbi:MAG: hypothetical protein ACXACU_04190 [Candidatus Hodarchaeales archaeon]|jgi:hypothetical protein
MKVNTTHNPIRNLQSMVDFGRNSPWVVLLGFIYLILATFVLTNPDSFSILSLEMKYAQFALSFVTLCISIVIGVNLLYQDFQASWGLSFVIYGVTFLGLSLEALGFAIADMSDPILFLVWRTPMLIFVSIMWINLTSLFTENKKLIYLPAALIALIGEGWFIYGLLSLKDITLTMNAFLYGLFVPMMLISSYLLYKFSKETSFSSTSLIALGYLMIGLIYTQWVPWHTGNSNPIYAIFFTILTISLVMILRGFSLLSTENRVNV